MPVFNSPKPENKFADEFALQLKTGYLRDDPHAKEFIGKALQSAAQLSRVFDQVPIAIETKHQMYQQLKNAPNTQEHIHVVVRAVAKTIFNSSMSDLNDDIKKSMGDEQYNGLIKACNTKETMIDLLIQSIAVSYAQVLTDVHKTIENPDLLDMRALEKIILTNDITRELNKEKLFPSILSQIKDYFLSLGSTNESQKTRARKIEDKACDTIESLDKYLRDNASLSPSMVTSITEAKKMLSNEVTASNEVYLRLGGDDLPVLLTEESAKKKLNNVCANIAEAIETHLLPLEKQQKGFVEKIFEKIITLFNPSKNIAPESILDISKTLKHADPAIREKMKEMKTKIHDVKEAELTDVQKEKHVTPKGLSM